MYKCWPGTEIPANASGSKRIGSKRVYTTPAYTTPARLCIQMAYLQKAGTRRLIRNQNLYPMYPIVVRAKDLARALNVSEKTARKYLSQIRKLLDKDPRQMLTVSEVARSLDLPDNELAAGLRGN